MRRLIGNCKRGAILSSIDFSIHPNRIIIIMNPDNYNGDALLHYVGTLRPARDKHIHLNGRAITCNNGKLADLHRHVNVMFRDCRLFPRLAIQSGIVLTPLGITGHPGSRMRGRTRTLLSHIGLLGGTKDCPQRLSNNRGRHITVIHTLTVRPRVLLFSRIATTLSPRVIHRIRSIVLSLTGRNHAVVVIARRVRFTHTVTSHIVFLSNNGVIRRDAPRTFFSRPGARHTRGFLHAFAFSDIGW